MTLGQLEIRSIRNSRKGSVLLLALLILSAVLAATTAVSTLVVREIRSNRQIDNAVLAYYAAESGIERGLWQTSVTPPTGPITAPGVTTTLPNDARTTLQTKNVGTSILVPFLAKNTKTNVDLYNPSGTTAATLAAGVTDLTVAKEGGAVTMHCKEWKEEAGVFIDCADVVVGANGFSGLKADRAYRIVLEAGSDDVHTIRVSGTKADGSGLAQLPIPLTIESTGAFTTSRQALSITVPTRSLLDTTDGGTGAGDGGAGSDTGGGGGGGGTGGGGTGDGSNGAQLPEARAGDDVVVLSGQAVQFDGSASIAGSYPPLSYYWDRDASDGLSFEPRALSADFGTAKPPPYTYTTAGVYTATLLVVDHKGRESRDALTVIVNDFPLTLTTTTPTINVGSRALLRAEGAPVGEERAMRYFWVFGKQKQGTASETNFETTSFPGPVAEKRPLYPEAGIYSTFIYAKSTSGKRAWAGPVTVTVHDITPVAEASVRSERTKEEERTKHLTGSIVGELLSFRGSATSSNPSHSLTYTWDFGDGTNAATAVIEKVYTTPGTYTVQLHLCDLDNKLCDDDEVKVDVLAQPPGMQYLRIESAFKPPFALHPETFFFPSASFGIVSGGGGTTNYVKTTDGGRTWTTFDIRERTTPTVPMQGMSMMFFLDERHGWTGVWGCSATQMPAVLSLLHTSDGGASWSALPITNTVHSGACSGRISTIFFHNPHEGWIVTGVNNKIRSTGDGGVHWTDHSETAPLRDVSFFDKNVGRALRMSDYVGVVGTNDGGKRWNLIFSNSAPAGLFFQSSTNGWFWTNNKELFSSTNLTDWKPVPLPQNFNVGSLFFLDAQRGIIAGFPAGSMFVTSDKGKTWVPPTLLYASVADKFLVSSLSTSKVQSSKDGELWFVNDSEIIRATFIPDETACPKVTPQLAQPGRNDSARVGTEDDPYTYNVQSDVEGRDGTRYELITKPEAPSAASWPASVMQMDPVTGVLTWLPVNDQVGVHTVKYKVTEKCGGSTTQEYVVSVNNDPPIITSTPLVTAKVGDLYTYDVQNDNDEAVGATQYTLTLYPEGMTIDHTTGVIRWIPQIVDSGKVRFVTIEVDDTNGGIHTQSFNIFISSSFDPSTLTMTKYDTGFEASETNDIAWVANTLWGKARIAMWEERKIQFASNPDTVAAIEENIADIRKRGWMIGQIKDRTAQMQGSTKTLTDGVVLYTQDGGRTWTRKATIAKTVTNTNVPAWWYYTYPAAISFWSPDDGVMGFTSPDNTPIKWTSDRGRTWNDATGSGLDDIRQFTFVEEDFKNYYYPDAIFAAGKSGIAKSVDAGRTWSLVKAVPTTVRLYSVAFRNAAHAWAVGTKDIGGGTLRGIILKTSDGGTIWTEEERTDMTDMRRVTFAHGKWWIAGGGISQGVRLLSIGGDGSTTVAIDGSSPFQVLNAISFSSLSDEGWAVGSVRQGVVNGLAMIFKTTNQGQTWTRQESHFTESVSGVDRVEALGGDSAVAVARAGYFFSTDDGGQTWTTRGNQRGMTIRKIVPFTATLIFATAKDGETPLDGRILVSTDGGRTWERRRLTITNGERPDIIDTLFFLDDKNGWAKGRKASGNNAVQLIFLKTTNGGATWTSESMAPTTGITMETMNNRGADILFLTPLYGFITGDARGIYAYSTSGGTGSWRYIPIATTDVYPIAFVRPIPLTGSGEFYVLTLSSQIYKRGVPWQLLTEQPNLSYASQFHIAPSGKRWAAGLKPAFTPSSIAGALDDKTPWQLQTMEGLARLALMTDFTFFDEEKAIAVGQKSSLFYTSDGATWKRPTLLPSGFTLPTNLLLTDVAFQETIGFIGTNAGYIYTTRPQRTDRLGFSIAISGSTGINEGDNAVITVGGTLPKETITFYFNFDATKEGEVTDTTFDDQRVTTDGTPVQVLPLYTTAGTYTISVLGVTESGQRARAATTVHVQNVPPTANAGRDITVRIGQTVPFNGDGSYAGDYDEIFFYWDVDARNGLSFQSDLTKAELRGAAPQTPPNAYTYTSAGVYTATLRVCDDDRSCADDTVQVTVHP